MITIDDFKKLEIKIGRVTDAQRVEGTDKLIKLTVDLGDETRTILTALAQLIDPTHFVGKQMPFITNLEPRTLKGVESQGMMLATDTFEKPILIHPEKEVPNGSVVV